MDKRDEADAAKKKMSLPDGSSDHLTLVKAFAGWLEAKKKFGASGERKYCGTHFLSAVSLLQIADRGNSIANYSTKWVSHTRRRERT